MRSARVGRQDRNSDSSPITSLKGRHYFGAENLQRSRISGIEVEAASTAVGLTCRRSASAKAAEEHMEHHHSFPKALAVGLAMACLAGAQYACQAEAPDQAAAGEQLDAEPAQSAGDGGVH